MHELGIVYQVIKVVDGFCKDNHLTTVEKIVLEVGELSQAIPRFIEECYPAAVSETQYENTELDIIVIKATGECKQCQTTYKIVDHRKVCPSCGASDFTLITGQEFQIKEIVAC